MRNRFPIGLLALSLAASAALAAEPLPAFPGAEGFGALAKGGRGGDVYIVTSLEDDGPGSLREGLRKGNRTIVFAVSGNIELKKRLELKVNNVTIAGQTAPGGGITLKNYYFSISGQDLIIRYLRTRLGDVAGEQTDSLTLQHGSSNVILDHISATWSVDEALSLSGNNQNITVQWCLIGESLKRSVHVKGDHGFGSLSRANGPVTWHHNLWVHNDARNPRLGDNYGKEGEPFFDVINNVIYNYGGTCSGLTQGKFSVNYLGNYIKPGPNSNKKKAPIEVGKPSTLRFFIADNFIEGNPTLSADNSQMIGPTDEAEIKVELVSQAFPTSPIPVTRTSAKEAYEQVLARVGASLPLRDAVDTRIIGHVRTGTGGMINSPKDVGGYPDLPSAPPTSSAPVDTDKDGIPDEWEKANGLNPNDPTDGPKAPDGGYTNLEKYLNSLVK